MRELHCNSHRGKPKRRFENRTDAQQFIGDRRLKNMKPYECPDCGKWHLKTVHS